MSTLAKASSLTARAKSMATNMADMVKADELAIAFKDFKKSIEDYTVALYDNKQTNTTETRKILLENAETINVTCQKMEKALRDYSKTVSPEYKAQLDGFSALIRSYRIHIVAKLIEQLKSKTPTYFYKEKRTNTFNQNLRNNVIIRKTRQKSYTNSTTGKDVVIDYISMPRLRGLLEDILPERSLSKMNSTSRTEDVENIGKLYETSSKGGRHRKTYRKKRIHRNRHTRRN
jgi:hypothetical protein